MPKGKVFKGFSDSQMKRIAEKSGFTGPISEYRNFLRSNPALAAKFAGLEDKARMKFNEGGSTTGDQGEPDNTVDEGTSTGPMIRDEMVQRAMDPGVPVGGAYIPTTVDTTDTGQFLGDTTAGKVGEELPSVTQDVATTTTATQPSDVSTTTYDATKAGEAVTDVTDKTEAVQGKVSDDALVDAQTMDPTRTQVGTTPAAQIEDVTTVKSPQSRTLQEGELVQSTFNARKAASFAEEIDAAQANPTANATVQGQMDNLMKDFDGGQTPPWAAGALRNATAQMAARGLTSSSLAGQALVQAAMEAALPIAQADANTVATFELQNLSNRQARAMLAAEQRANFIGREFDMEFQAQVMNASKVSDIANMNFNAEQQIALENARLAQTANLANLSNRQAMVMAEAAQIANLEVTNLNNRQQAAVQNAQSFLQMDFANLSNEQQTMMFNAQSQIQAILSDTAAENASKQFNASSENQVNQFNANLAATISQFNATQSNAMEQFNSGEANSISKMVAEMENVREQFNANNQLVIEQADAQWRRQIATLDTASINAANQFNATAILDISNTAYANLWQQARDSMEWAWTSTENERQRDSALAISKLQVDASKYAADAKEDAASSAAWGKVVFDLIKGW